MENSNFESRRSSAIFIRFWKSGRGKKRWQARQQIVVKRKKEGGQARKRAARVTRGDTGQLVDRLQNHGRSSTPPFSYTSFNMRLSRVASFFPPLPFFPFNRGKNNVEYPKNFPPRLFPSFRFCKTYSLNDLEAECTSHTFDRVPLPGFEFFFRGNSNLSNQLFELRLEYIYTRVVKFYFSAYECQGNRHFVHWGGRNRGWGGEARSLKRFFPTSRVALRYWNGPTASSVGGMALVRTQHVLYAASHSRRGKEGKKRETKKRKEGKGRKGVGSPLVSGCWWTLLHFIPCFPPWLRASWILYDRHSPHHRLFCLLLPNNTRPRPIYVKCTVLRNILFVSHNNLYPRFFFFSFYLDKISHVSIREFRVFQIQSRYRDCY